MTKDWQFINAMAPYLNVDHMAGGHPVNEFHTRRNNDNHGMFTAEYLRIVNDLNPALRPDECMEQLVDDKGVLHRYMGDIEPDLSPDNLLGFLNYVELRPEKRPLAKRIYDRGRKGWGSYTTPWSAEGFLFRQPQLIMALIAASGGAAWYKFWQWPLVIYTALVIAIAGRGIPAENDQDARRLSWHLIQIMKGHSLLCRLAARVWWGRLRKQYGDEGMRLVFGRYFNMEHPFAHFAINDWEINK